MWLRTFSISNEHDTNETRTTLAIRGNICSSDYTNISRFFTNEAAVREAERAQSKLHLRPARPRRDRTSKMRWNVDHARGLRPWPVNAGASGWWKKERPSRKDWIGNGQLRRRKAFGRCCCCKGDKIGLQEMHGSVAPRCGKKVWLIYYNKSAVCIRGG